jgi:hypothetical protein
MYDNYFWVEGDLMADGLTMKIVGVSPDGNAYFNTRMPVLNEDEVTYLVTRFRPTNKDPNAGENNLSPTEPFVMTWECQEKASAFDNVIRSGPSFTP